MLKPIPAAGDQDHIANHKDLLTEDVKIGAANPSDLITIM
jgi:hypothetical protein